MGRAVDLLEFDGVVGSVAGDDTVLVVLTSEARARGFKRYLDRLAAGESDFSQSA